MYNNVIPRITCTKQSGAEEKQMPIIPEQETAFFERLFRAQAKNAHHSCGPERYVSSMLLLGCGSGWGGLDNLRWRGIDFRRCSRQACASHLPPLGLSLQAVCTLVAACHIHRGDSVLLQSHPCLSGVMTGIMSNESNINTHGE